MNDCLGECTPEPGSREAGEPVQRRWRELRPLGPHFSGERWGCPQEDPQATFWHRALLSALLWGLGFSSQSNLHFSILCGPQMNGTRPGTGSTKLTPWDKSSHSGHRVDLSAV